MAELPCCRSGYRRAAQLRRGHPRSGVAPLRATSERSHAGASRGGRRPDRRHRSKAAARPSARVARRGIEPERTAPLEITHPPRVAPCTRKDSLAMTLEISRQTRAVFPVARPRRLRRTDALRRMVRETRLSVDQL